MTINLISLDNTLNNKSLLQDAISWFTKIGFDNEIQIDPLEMNSFAIPSFSVSNYFKENTYPYRNVLFCKKNDNTILVNKKLWDTFLTTNKIKVSDSK